VAAARRQVVRASRRHAQQAPLRVEQVEQREEIMLVGAAAVEQDEGALGLPGGLSDAVGELRHCMCNNS